MLSRFSHLLGILIVCSALTACSDSGEPTSEKSRPAVADAPRQPAADMVTAAEDVVADTVAATESKTEAVTDEAVQQAEEVAAKAETMVDEAAQQTEEAMAMAATASEETVAEASAAMEDIVSADKPYQLIDGKISDNVMEGWRTYNGGGCGACHGKGGIGAVGPNLAVSVAEKLTKDQFENIVANGVSGTMMRPHNTNTRVMDNLDNLYAYLVARGDGVLGPGNLIKSPLGKE